jgi:hypothetical protein
VRGVGIFPEEYYPCNCLTWVTGWANGNGPSISQAVKSKDAKQYFEHHSGVNICSETQAGEVWTRVLKAPAVEIAGRGSISAVRWTSAVGGF